MTVSYSTTKPQRIQYMPLPTGQADVWLHENIEQETLDMGDGAQEVWKADEVYFRTSMTLEEVNENFDTLFANDGPVYDEETGTEEPTGITLADRVAALEEEVKELEAWHEEVTNVQAGPEEDIVV